MPSFRRKYFINHLVAASSEIYCGSTRKKLFSVFLLLAFEKNWAARPKHANN
jgi:hypothetical protein